MEDSLKVLTDLVLKLIRTGDRSLLEEIDSFFLRRPLTNVEILYVCSTCYMAALSDIEKQIKRTYIKVVD